MPLLYNKTPYEQILFRDELSYSLMSNWNWGRVIWIMKEFLIWKKVHLIFWIARNGRRNSRFFFFSKYLLKVVLWKIVLKGRIIQFFSHVWFAFPWRFLRSNSWWKSTFSSLKSSILRFRGFSGLTLLHRIWEILTRVLIYASISIKFDNDMHQCTLMYMTRINTCQFFLVKISLLHWRFLKFEESTNGIKSVVRSGCFIELMQTSCKILHVEVHLNGLNCISKVYNRSKLGLIVFQVSTPKLELIPEIF